MLYIIIFYTKNAKVRIKKSYTQYSSYTLSPRDINNEQNRGIVFNKYLMKYMLLFKQHY
jgi:hypothetical protein